MAYSYEVVRPFVDAEDNKPYVVNDIYPTDITDERITQLLHADNKYNKQYIKLVVDSKNTKAELIEIAHKHGIEVSENDTKADILDTLRDNMATLIMLSYYSINDNVQDELLKRIIDNTEKRLISILPIDIEEVPDRLGYIVEEVAVKRFNRVGAEGMTQEKMGVLIHFKQTTLTNIWT